jgi:hypothetical protein
MRIDLQDTPYHGATSRPAAGVGVSQNCRRCGSSLRGRLEEVRRQPKFTLWVWECRCGARRRVRKAAG